MKMNLNNWIVATGLFFASVGFAQAQDLPRPSPQAEVQQRIGLSDITVNYSRPAVKGRKVFGDLVPYGELWRTGANESVLLTVTEGVKINGTAIDAGEYALFTVPGETEWEVVINTETSGWGTGAYKKENDVMRFKVKAQSTSHMENMAFVFTDITGTTGNLVLHWEKVMIAIPIEVEVAALAMKNIEEAIANAKPDDFRVYRNAANYCAESKTNLDQGMKWIEKSLEIKENWYSFWVKADLHAAKGDYKGAIAAAEKAIELGEAASKENGREFKYKGQLQEEITKWKSMK